MKENKKALTRFEKDYEAVMEENNEEEIITRRQEEINRLRKEGRACKNKFRLRCIAQDLVKREKELKILVDLIY